MIMAEKATKQNKSMEEVRKKSDKDLLKMLGEKREEGRHFRFGTAGAATRDVRAVRTNKRDIARILTELNARDRRMAEETKLTSNE